MKTRKTLRRDVGGGNEPLNQERCLGLREEEGEGGELKMGWMSGWMGKKGKAYVRTHALTQDASTRQEKQPGKRGCVRPSDVCGRMK
jgi:hypothetical protein